MTVSSPKMAKRIALIIGNAEYQALRPLPNPGNDVETIAATLTELNFDIYRCTNAGQFQMHNALDAFIREASTNAAEVCLIFYSGHGLEIDGKNYLVPVDICFPLRQQIPNLYPLQHYLNEFGRVFHGEILIFLDACRTNPFGTTTPADIDEIKSRFNPDLLIPPRNCFLAFATAPGRTASDGRKGKNSPFTRALKAHMATNGLEVNEMMQRVRNELLARVDKLGVHTGDAALDAERRAARRKKLQIPWTTSSLERRFYFKPISSDGLLTITLLGAASALFSVPIRFGALKSFGILESQCRLGEWCADWQLFWNGIWFATACAYGMWRWGRRDALSIVGTFFIYAAIAQLGVIIVSMNGQHLSPASSEDLDKIELWRNIVIAAVGGAVTAAGAVLSGAIFSPALRKWGALVTCIVIGALITLPLMIIAKSGFEDVVRVVSIIALASVWHGLIAFTIGWAYVHHVPTEPERMFFRRASRAFRSWINWKWLTRPGRLRRRMVGG